jgi:Tfp pilus assembly protein PilV
MHALRQDAAELILSAGAALQARQAAGTLLPGACRPYEVEYEEAFLGPCVPPPMAAFPAAVSAFKAQVGRFFGYATFIYGAAQAAEFQMFCSTGAVSLTAAQREELWALLIDALDLMTASAANPLVAMAAGYQEAGLVNNVQQLFRDGCVPTSGAGARVRDAWSRLERSGVLVTHRMGGAVEMAQSHTSRHERVSMAAAAAPGLRSCALPGCGTREVHPSHFKACGACKTAVYCSKEHQTTDWPRHKPDCKAARKAD